MSDERTLIQNFVLHELEPALATELCHVVAQPGRTIRSTTSTRECIAIAQRGRADVVFCGSRAYQRLLDALDRGSLQVPVVVVSRIPETSEWLDAIDAGATDYCAAPFERQHISWLVHSALLAGQRVAMGAR
jgi:DNA-binding NtrC family response regulator